MAFLQQLQALIEEDPIKSLRQLTHELDVSPILIRQAVHEDLRFKSYVLRVLQLLTDRLKADGGNETADDGETTFGLAET